jgi:hypothetical protein
MGGISGLIPGVRGNMLVINRMIEERNSMGRVQLAGMQPRSCGMAMECQTAAHPCSLRVQRLRFYPQQFQQLPGKLTLRVEDHERSPFRERFCGHNFKICNNRRHKRNHSPTLAGRQCPAFSLPNIC